MKSRPLLCNAPMVGASLNGSKTQTRRVVKLKGFDGIQPDHSVWRFCEFQGPEALWQHRTDIQRVLKHACPYGQPGDRLWVKETWRTTASLDHLKPSEIETGALIEYSAGGNSIDAENVYGMARKWRSPLFMQERFSRIQLEITGVRVERLQDISEQDAKAEGAQAYDVSAYSDLEIQLLDAPVKERSSPYRNGFSLLWESINGSGSWDQNQWVWVIEFRRTKP